MKLGPVIYLCVFPILCACGQQARKYKTVPVLREVRTCIDPAVHPIWIPEGDFRMVSGQVSADGRSVRRVHVNGFWLDRHEVTNSQFAKFVEETGYVTVAERAEDPAGRSIASGGGSTVPGAYWVKPHGSSGPDALANEPVVRVAFEDAEAYAHWAGARLPTAVEWKYAARAGRSAAHGRSDDAGSRQSVVQIGGTGKHGFPAMAPVGCQEPNAFGLYDMAGNVWEWASGQHASDVHPLADNTADMPGYADGGSPNPVDESGVLHCSRDICRRDRAAAHVGQEIDSETSHIGFRTVPDLPHPTVIAVAPSIPEDRRNTNR